MRAPNNSLKLTRRAGPYLSLSCRPTGRRIELGLPASAGQLSSRPLGVDSRLTLEKHSWRTMSQLSVRYCSY